MRTPWLLRSDCLLGESVHHSIAGFQGSFLSRQPCPPVYFCRSPFSATCALVEPDAFNWSPKVRSLVEACFRRTFSVRVSASPGPDVASTGDEFHGDDGSLFDRELNRYRGLVLDVAYRPINVVCWRRALCLEILEKADVLQYYDQVINSPSRPFAIPAVLRITDYVHTPKRAKVRLALNRKNIYLRDKYRCQYCKSHENLTIDHVVPLSRGGGWTWQNLVTACAKCNARKSDKTPEEANMQLLKKPKEPKLVDGRDMPSNYAAYRTLQSARQMPDEWIDYLPKRAQASDSS